MNTAAAAIMMFAQGMQEYVVQVRNELHAHPEMRWTTRWTRNYIFSKLVGMGFKPRKVESGIVVDITGSNPKAETILCRADFDALPQVGHACGHDINTAMLLGALKAISEGRVKPSCNIQAYFDDAEENPGTSPRPESGAEVAVKDGITCGVSRAYALHIWNHPDGAKPGTFRSRPGPLLGNSGRIYFKIKCSGGHVACPHTGVNALRVANQIMNHLSGFVTRNFAPTEPATLEPAVLKAGEGTNVMPATAEMWWGFRTMLPRDQHETMTKIVFHEAEMVAINMGAKLEDVKLVYGHPATINDEYAFSDMARILVEAGEKVEEIPPMLGGESFGYIANKVPAAMFLLDAYTEGSGDHHSPTFNPDEQWFWKGVYFWLLLWTN